MASVKARGKLPEQIDLTREKPAGFQPHSGAKKLVIKNLRTSGNREVVAQRYYAKTLLELGEAVGAILSGRAPSVPLERLYRGGEDVCRKGDAEVIHRMLKDKIEKHLQHVVLPRIPISAGISSIETLSRVLAEWTAWNKQMVGYC